MGINKIIIHMMAIFAVLGALDAILGNRFRLGEKFEEGIKSAGVLALSMVGMISLAPVLAELLQPVVLPIFRFLGADPAMFAGVILANDMGGASLAQALTLNADAGDFGGLIVGSMLGATIVFIIPAALGIAEEKDKKCIATGVLAGIITVPIGSFAGGLVAGYSIEMMIKNLIPIILIACLMGFGLWKFEKNMIKGFAIFSKGIAGVITIGLILGIVEKLTGIVLLPGMNPISEGFTVVADIAVVLAGACPMMYVITNLLKKPLNLMGYLLGINETAAAGLVASLANCIPMLGMLKNMDERGKIINMAFATSAAFVLGDHLGFTAGFNAEMIFPMIVGKLIGGITAVICALLILKMQDIK